MMHDHTGSFSFGSAIDGREHAGDSDRPDHDHAGAHVEKVAKTKRYREPLVFVVREDDAQDGRIHVRTRHFAAFARSWLGSTGYRRIPDASGHRWGDIKQIHNT